MPPRLVLVRHGETEWSRTRRHTSHTDIPLTDRGREQAAALRPVLAEHPFARALSSPRTRARETAALARPGAALEHAAGLVEWEYGAYEGRTTADIHSERPDWQLWRDGCPDGEQPAEVGARVDALLAELADEEGDVLLVAHGHVLRVLGARWLGLEPAAGRLLVLDPATVSLLGHEHDWTALRAWNAPGAGVTLG